MLLGTLGDSLLGSALTGWGVIRADEGRIRAGQHFSNFKLTNFEIKTYYENEPKCDGIYSRDNLTKAKDGTYTINLDVYDSSFGVEDMQKNSEIYSRIFVEYKHRIQ